MVNDFTYNNTIYIMNKLLKYTLGILTIWICTINTSNANNIEMTFFANETSEIYFDSFIDYNSWNVWEDTITYSCDYEFMNITNDLEKTIYVQVYHNWNEIDSFEFYVDWMWNGDYYTNYSFGTIQSRFMSNAIWFQISTDWDDDYVWAFIICTISWNWVYMSDSRNEFQLSWTNNQQCPSCPSQYTSLECQTEYNLIPITSVTENYCKLNFDLIAPTECPNIWEWTWEINRTARYINNTQYPWTASLKLNIADFLERQTTYNENETIIEVLWYDADENYINWIIAKEQLTPTPQDFETLIVWLQEFIPYIFIAMIIAFFLMLVKRFFR